MCTVSYNVNCRGLRRNRLSGVLPQLPPKLYELYLDDNLFGGTLPTLSTSLELLWVNNNNFNGPILPSNITGLSDW
jgi:hypothetical protein